MCSALLKSESVCGFGSLWQTWSCTTAIWQTACVWWRSSASQSQQRSTTWLLRVMSRLVSDHIKLHNPLLGLENKLQIKISFQNWVFLWVVLPSSLLVISCRMFFVLNVAYINVEHHSGALMWNWDSWLRVSLERKLVQSKGYKLLVGISNFPVLFQSIWIGSGND